MEAVLPPPINWPHATGVASRSTSALADRDEESGLIDESLKSNHIRSRKISANVWKTTRCRLVVGRDHVWSSGTHALNHTTTSSSSKLRLLEVEQGVGSLQVQGGDTKVSRVGICVC